MATLSDRTARLALGAAARWFGFAVALMPVIDIADRDGLFVALSAPQALDLGSVAIPLVQIGFFVALGIAAAALIRRHRPRGRMLLFAGCAIPLIAYVLHGGLRLSSAAGLVALVFSFVQLRLAAGIEPAAPPA